MERWQNSLVNTAKHAINILTNVILPPNPAIVFDIDNTLLDHNKDVIIPIRNIYYYALMLNISIVIITCRIGTQEIINLTKQELKKEGINKVRYMYFRKNTDTNYWSYKDASRKNVIDKGYNIVMSIGDKDWDIIGNYTGFSIKVPHI